MMPEYKEFEAKILADAQAKVEECKYNLKCAEHHLAILVKIKNMENNNDKK